MTASPHVPTAAAVPRGATVLVATLGGLLVLLLAGLVVAQQWSAFPERRIGGDFALVDQDGRRVTAADLGGRPSVFFFGYTACPDVCPTTLAELSGAMERMGPVAGKLNVVFVSLDPERDTPAQLKAYLSSFDPRIRGFTGTTPEVEAAARSFHVRYRRVPLPNGGYTVDHAASVMLFDKTRRLVGMIDGGSDDEDVRVRLTALAEPGVCHRGVPTPTDLWGPWRPGATSLCASS